MCYQQNRLALSTADALRSVGEVDSAGENEIQILIGAKLKRLRKQRGLSRRQLARLAQVERSTLRQLERGALTPSVGMLWKLARELHVPCTAFIEHEPQPTGLDNLRGRAGWLAIGATVSSAWRQNRRDPAANAAH
jgi:transcriptional regulator with XRE-family HTH domain